MASKIRLVDKDGEMVGIVSKLEGLKQAREAGLDLIEVSPNAEPPVCKILDYGKFKYELQKKKHESKKKQKIVEIKEIQLRPVIDENDLQVKCRAIRRFIEEGNKVKITMRFQGRELSHQEIGVAVLTRVQTEFQEIAKVESPPRLEGKRMIMMMAPK